MNLFLMIILVSSQRTLLRQEMVVKSFFGSQSVGQNSKKCRLCFSAEAVRGKNKTKQEFFISIRFNQA